MSREDELVELVGRRPDPRLLGEGQALLPPDVGRPIPIPPDPRRARITGLGATLTGVSLVGGIALVIAGVLSLGAVAIVIGALLVITHWGWVHVAEVTANSLESSHQRTMQSGNEAWLARIEPFARWSVSTSVAEDGTIVIERVCHRPVPVGADTFGFARQVELTERHDGDQPGAAVTERAELLRRDAAVDTARERERYELAADAYRLAALEHRDEEERRAAVRAASLALSERINANLREPPLVE